MLKSYLCDYSDVHILVKGTVVGTGGTVVVVQADRNNKKQYSKFMYLLLAA